jgi:hypothetical protein
MCSASLSVIAMLFLVCACMGCQSPGTYLTDRALDLWDCVPTAVTLEPGLSVSARVTPFMETGFGFTSMPAARGPIHLAWDLSEGGPNGRKVQPILRSKLL